MKISLIPVLLLILITSLYIGCSKDHSHEEDSNNGHSNNEEPEALVYTIYTDRTELFVEFKPLVKDSPSKFAAHFTRLGKLFKPFTEGRITVSLTVNDNTISQSADTVSSPGIFRLALTPEITGNGKLVFDILTPEFSDRIVIENLRVYADEESAITGEQSGDDSGDLVYLKEQAWKVDFANEPVIKEPISEIIKTSGQILSAPGDEMIVSSIARGTIGFANNNLLVGKPVGQGSSLFTIASGDFADGNLDTRYDDALSVFEKTETDLIRAEELVKDKIISEKEYQEIYLRYRNAKTMYDAISKNYSGSGQSISSPMSGYIKNILIAEGQFVEPGTPLMTISKNRSLILQANISQKYFEKLPLISSANFKTNDGNETYNTDELNGRKISYGKSIDSRSVFIPVIFEIDNTFKFIPGSAVEIFLKCAKLEDAMVIPLSSVLEEQENFFVYVQTGGESFQKRQVKLGVSDGIKIQVLSGLEIGERVVTVGAYQVKLATMSGTLPEHGHEH